MTTPSVPLDLADDLAARIDSVQHLLLFFRVGPKPNRAAVDALIHEVLRRLATPSIPDHEQGAR